jgi:hypothetical protein
MIDIVIETTEAVRARHRIETESERFRLMFASSSVRTRAEDRCH